MNVTDMKSTKNLKDEEIELLEYDVTVIGAGPAGLAAAAKAHDQGARVSLVERENRMGGILKQCIHDGFGLIRYKNQLTGPEYACLEIKQLYKRNITVFNNTFLQEITILNEGQTPDGNQCHPKIHHTNTSNTSNTTDRVQLAAGRHFPSAKPATEDQYVLTMVSPQKSLFQVRSKALIIATGCRERTDRQIFIHGPRPAGIFTAGLAQYIINVQGYLPGKCCVILGSGDIGLIMARRLVLEGAQVPEVAEIKSGPSGLTRNIVQCLEDYNIPLNYSTTVIKVHGRRRVEGVTLAEVDPADTQDTKRFIPGTERYVACDTLIVSVGLIPENDILFPLDIALDQSTQGPLVDQHLMTNRPGIFSCGNALYVSDLVDYVSETGDLAGLQAASYALGGWVKQTFTIPVVKRGAVQSVVPQQIRLSASEITGRVTFYFRSVQTLNKSCLTIKNNSGTVLLTKKYVQLKPPEMERIELDLSLIPADTCYINFILTVESQEKAEGQGL